MNRLGLSSQGHMARAALAVCVACVVAVAAWMYTRCPGRERFQSQEGTSRPSQPETVFVSIASYRDADCSATIKSLFENAKHPSRVFVGVCEQNAEDSETCECGPWKQQVRKVSIPHGEAKGPTFARYLCSTLFAGETFFCQMDSHMRCTPDWDERAIGMMKTCHSARPVLTHYPLDVKDAGARGVPVLCGSAFDVNGIPTFTATTLEASSRPRPVPFVAGGFMFAPGSIIADVPFDPNLPHLFQGEEILYSARLWTSGYDFFTPSENLVWHHYYRNEAPKFWQDIDFSEPQKRTMRKVRNLLRGRRSRYTHGMGTSRTLKEYWSFAGLDWTTKTSTSSAKLCA
jgi:hypothetical protein